MIEMKKLWIFCLLLSIVFINGCFFIAEENGKQTSLANEVYKPIEKCVEDRKSSLDSQYKTGEITVKFNADISFDDIEETITDNRLEMLNIDNNAKVAIVKVARRKRASMGL